MLTYEAIGEARYLTGVEGIKSNLITGARLAFIFLLLSESPPWRERALTFKGADEWLY